MPLSARNICWILLYSSALASCSDTGNQYRNTENLERPPAIAIDADATPVQAPIDPVTTSESVEKGLDDQVHLDKAGGASTLVIKRPFEQAWFILGVLLNQLGLEITDRNRDEGYYYVKYDPDIDYSKPQGFWDAMASMFHEDSYSERTYALKLVEISHEFSVKLLHIFGGERIVGLEKGLGRMETITHP